jgi:hypothetical protein
MPACLPACEYVCLFVCLFVCLLVGSQQHLLTRKSPFPPMQAVFGFWFCKNLGQDL